MVGEEDESGKEAGHLGVPDGLDTVHASTVEGGSNR
jgi:hypothetical protein